MLVVRRVNSTSCELFRVILPTDLSHYEFYEVELIIQIFVNRTHSLAGQAPTVSGYFQGWGKLSLLNDATLLLIATTLGLRSAKGAAHRFVIMPRKPAVCACQGAVDRV